MQSMLFLLQFLTFDSVSYLNKSFNSMYQVGMHLFSELSSLDYLMRHKDTALVLFSLVDSQVIQVFDTLGVYLLALSLLVSKFCTTLVIDLIVSSAHLLLIKNVDPSQHVFRRATIFLFKVSWQEYLR